MTIQETIRMTILVLLMTFIIVGFQWYKDNRVSEFTQRLTEAESKPPEVIKVYSEPEIVIKYVEVDGDNWVDVPAH